VGGQTSDWGEGRGPSAPSPLETPLHGDLTMVCRCVVMQRYSRSEDLARTKVDAADST